MKKVYRSAIDAWFALLLVGLPLGLAIAGGWMAFRGERQGVVLIAQALFVVALMLVTLLPCVYTLTDRELQIRCGVFRSTIPLAGIETVDLSRSLWSAPALSLRRVRIVHRGGTVVISPQGREAFVADLQAAMARHRAPAS